MADENDASPTSETLTTDAPAVVPIIKKQRAPRRSKAAIEAAFSAASAATTMKATKKTGSRGTRKAGAVGQAKAPATTSLNAADEMADLIQLEEENKQLRKTLSEKLRAENADLRKRLGV
jgi:hypothetical protein